MKEIFLRHIRSEPFVLIDSLVTIARDYGVDNPNDVQRILDEMVESEEIKEIVFVKTGTYFLAESKLYTTKAFEASVGVRSERF